MFKHRKELTELLKSSDVDNLKLALTLLGFQIFESNEFNSTYYEAIKKTGNGFKIIGFFDTNTICFKKYIGSKILMYYLKQTAKKIPGMTVDQDNLPYIPLLN